MSDDDGGRGSSGGPFHPSLDDAVFRAMSERARRFVLYFLLEHDEASLERLADVVTGWSTVGSPGMATPDDRNRVRTNLHHRHLGALERADLIVRDGDVVRLAPLSDPVRDLLDWARRSETAIPSRSEGGDERGDR